MIAIAGAIAALLQWSIPHGWMIGTDASGGVALVACPGTSPELARLGPAAALQGHAHHAMAPGAHHHSSGPHSSGHPAAQGHGQDDGPEGIPGLAEAACDFAALAAIGLPASGLALPEVSFDQPLVRSGAFYVAPGCGLAAPPPPATGPPILTA